MSTRTERPPTPDPGPDPVIPEPGEIPDRPLEPPGTPTPMPEPERPGAPVDPPELFPQANALPQL